MVVNKDVLRLAYDNIDEITKSIWLVYNNNNEGKKPKEQDGVEKYLVVAWEEEIISLGTQSSVKVHNAGSRDKPCYVVVASTGAVTYLFNSNKSKTVIKIPCGMYVGDIMYGIIALVEYSKSYDGVVVKTETLPYNCVVYNPIEDNILLNQKIVYHSKRKRMMQFLEHDFWCTTIDEEGNRQNLVALYRGMKDKDKMDRQEEAALARASYRFNLHHGNGNRW